MKYRIVVFALIAFITACAAPAPSPEAPHMAHVAQHGGTLGMGPNVHIEVVSARAGEYKIYLYDDAGNSISTTGTQVEVALLDAAGKKSSSLPAAAVGAEYFIASAAEAIVTTNKVRIIASLKGKAEPIEMDFTLEYKSAIAPTITVRLITPTPTLTAARAATSAAPAGAPKTQWTETQRGLTAGAFFSPCHPQLGARATYGITLVDASGQSISDAAVELIAKGGMAGMEGEHDEDLSLNLPMQQSGIYRAEASLGKPDLVMGAITINVKRGNQSWSFVLGSDVWTKC